MKKSNPIRLKTSSITSVPFHAYEDFTFIVNGKKFKTNKISADLLSKKVSHLHFSDPTLNEFSITTEEVGNFSYFLQLLNFKQNQIPQTEIPFISEIIEKLEADSIDIQEPERIIISNNNVFELIKFHQKYPKFYSRNLLAEFEHISTHFYELYASQAEQLQSLNSDALEAVLSNPRLLVESEDQLINFLNELVSVDPSRSNLFEYVNFSNVSATMMKEFLHVFNLDNLTRETWNQISSRLELQVIPPKVVKKKKVPLFKTNQIVEIKYNEKNQLNGIINHLRTVYTDDNIYDEIEISSSSVYLNDDEYSPKNVIQYEDLNKEFCSRDSENSWLCFDFKEHRICVTDYTIRSFFGEINDEHPKSWVLEGSSDNNDWDVIDAQNNNSKLNGENIIINFPIKESNIKQFRYIRMRLTSENWTNTNCLDINAIEFYGSYN